MQPVPLWAVALGVATAAPWLVRAFASAIERRVRRRTSLVVAIAERARRATATMSHEGPSETGSSEP